MKRPLDIAAIALTSLLLVGVAVLSIRGLIDPQPASARFGTAINDGPGALFYRVYLSRNLVIVAAGAVFLLSRQWLPLAVLVTATAALPVFDMSVLALSGATPPAVHPIALTADRADRRSALAAGLRGQKLTDRLGPSCTYWSAADFGRIGPPPGFLFGISIFCHDLSVADSHL